MKTRLALGILLSSTIAAAQPAPGFAKATTYQLTTHSTMFACGMRDSNGMTYGTAKEITLTSRTTFQPNGTYTTVGNLTIGSDHGRYKLTGKIVKMTPVNADGSLGQSYDLALNADGSALGDMKRL